MEMIASSCFKLMDMIASSCFKLMEMNSNCFKLMEMNASSCFKLMDMIASSCFKLMEMIVSCCFKQRLHLVQVVSPFYHQGPQVCQRWYGLTHRHIYRQRARIYPVVAPWLRPCHNLTLPNSYFSNKHILHTI